MRPAGFALLAALLLGPRAAAADGVVPTPAAIDEAIDRGVAFLLGEQQATGAFDRGGRALGHTALAAYALLHAGLQAEASRPLARALAWLDANGPGRARRTDREADTYDTALLVLLLRDRGRAEDRPRLERLAALLVSMQAANGQWSYALEGGGRQASAGDNSNTQFAVLALGALAGEGVAVPVGTLAKAWAWWTGSGQEDGGFGYASGGSRASQSTGSMTAAGIASLAILEAALAGRAAEGAAVGEAPGRVLERAIQRLARDFAVDRNFGPSQGAAGQRQRAGGRGWLHYYLWSVERALVLAGRETIAARDWYREGAAHLLATQAGDGSWRGEHPLYATAFALLFLTRAADPPRAFTPPEAPPHGPVTPGGAAPQPPAPPPAPPGPELFAGDPGTADLVRRSLERGPASLEELVRALGHPDAARRQRTNEALRILLGDERVGRADVHPLARGRLGLWVRKNRRFLVADEGRFAVSEPAGR